MSVADQLVSVRDTEQHIRVSFKTVHRRKDDWRSYRFQLVHALKPKDLFMRVAFLGF